MSAPHFFADSVAGDRVRISGEDARHAVRVLRIGPGERITVSDGAGIVVDAVVIDTGPTIVAEATRRRAVRREPPLLTVFQGIAKGSKLDVVVQKLTEIGVDHIVPLRAGRSVPRWEDPGAKIRRLQTIAREAAKQSRRAWLPAIGEPVSVEDAPVDPTAIVLHPEASTRLSGALPEALPGRVSLFVGPEGGFADGEVDALVRRGAAAAGLGPTVLRTETAALVAAALVMARYGRIG